jgi:Domain of unknown function (DUF929)
MADNANDKPQRSAADKERSRQMSRSVSGRDAARSGGGGGRRPGQQPQGGGRNQRQAQGGRGAKGGQRQPQGPSGHRQAQGGRGGQTRSQPKAARTAGNRPGRPPRRPQARQGGSRTNLFIWGSIALVVVIVGIFVALNLSSTKPSAIIYTAKPVPATVLSDITHVPTSVYNSVGTGITGEVHTPRVETGQPALKYTGKPGVLGVFGQFCPYCAAERWAIITSFARFGSFSGLRTMQSSPVDYAPKTQTFTFEKATYRSPYFSAKLIEYFGQDYNKTGAHRVIGTLTKSQQKLVVKYDRSSTTASTSGELSIPFMDLGNQVINEGVSFTPIVLTNLTRTTIAGQLSTSKSDITKLIIGSSNFLSASLCHIDGGKPGSVCQSSGVQAAAKAMNLST